MSEKAKATAKTKSKSKTKTKTKLTSKSKTKTFLAAMAKADITPCEDVYLCGYTTGEDALARYPQNILSDLMARILLLDNGQDCLVFLNLELLFSDAGTQIGSVSKEMIKRIAAVCNTTAENVLLSNTHNHHAPQNLSKQAEDNVVAAVERAYKQRVRVKIGVNRKNTSFGVSRGRDYTIDFSLPYDNLMTVLRIDNAETGEPVGLVYSVPIHNTMFGNGKLNEESKHRRANRNLLCCEFTGYASRFIESEYEYLNSEFTAMHINGFYGNSGPLYKGNYAVDSFEELKEAGKHFGNEILNIYKQTESQLMFGEIKAATYACSLPTNPNRDFTEYFDDLESLPLYIKLGSFDKILYVGVNYEPFSIIGQRMKAESPFPTVLPAACVNGWNGYIPAKETFENNRFFPEAECSPVKTPFTAETEEIFYEKLISAISGYAGVRLERHQSRKISNKGFTSHGLFFDFGILMSADKLVITWGQNKRTDCISDFELILYDNRRNIVFSQRFSDNSLNYLGVFIPKEKQFIYAEIVPERNSLNNSEEMNKSVKMKKSDEMNKLHETNKSGNTKEMTPCSIYAISYFNI